MDVVMPWVVVLGSFGGVLGGLWWLAGRVRRRGVGRDLLGPVDLIYRPHTQMINIEAQRTAPPAPADDKPAS
jgi:hypothetical protein